MMQVSTRLFYDRAATAMATLTAKTDTLQTQIATGKRLAQASDDPVAWTRLQGLARGSADAAVTGRNLDLAAAVLAQADSTLDAIGNQLQRATELATKARGGTLDQTAKNAIAAELDEIVAQLVSLANTRDARDEAMFGGANGEAAVTRNADGSFTFATTLASAIPTGEGQSVQPGDTAARLFVQTGGNTLATVADLASTLRAGGVVAAATVTALTDAGTQATGVRTSLGARAQRVEMDAAALTQAGIDREGLRSGLEDTDITAAITELQKTMTILSATQASFTKLQGLSLFDYLR